MKNITVLIVGLVVVLLSSYKQETLPDNPLLLPYQTPFEVPPFEKIDSTHYIPAFLEGMIQQNVEINALINNTEEPLFDNTILAFDRSGKLLTQVSRVFVILNGVNTNEQMQAIARQINPLLSDHNDNIYLNEKLFARIKAVYDKRNEMKLDSQQIRATERYYRDFERMGANLPKEKQDQLRVINAELSMLSLTFSQNVLAETNKNFRLVVEDAADLAGLPQGVIDGAAEAANNSDLQGKWVFTLTIPSIEPFLKYADNRDLREKIYRGYFMRGNNGNANDNNAIVADIFKLRVKKAQLLGYKSYADYIIDDNMAKTPDNVYDFLMKLWDPAIRIAKREVTEMQKIIDREDGNFKLQSWDWWYYAEKLRKEKYDLDDNTLRPYFSLNNVRDGMFMVARKLYGITFTKRTDLPLYHKDVETYEVKEADGRPVGILYLDYYPRDGKSVGASSSELRSQIIDNGKRIDPIIILKYNLTKPTTDAPALLNLYEVATLFHEFGHSLHSLFAQGSYYRTARGVPRDYVELPSQIMENWAIEPEVLRSYAKHYETGEIIPDELINKIRKSTLFNQGFTNVELLAASLLDLDFHTLTDTLNIDIGNFETEAMKKIGLIDEILPRYRSTYFSHIISSGYAAGYYVYMWARMLDADAFSAFKKSGDIYNSELASKFRKYCLAESGTDEAMVQYRKFRGKDPTINPLLIRTGLK